MNLCASGAQENWAEDGPMRVNLRASPKSVAFNRDLRCCGASIINLLASPFGSSLSLLPLLLMLLLTTINVSSIMSHRLLPFPNWSEKS